MPSDNATGACMAPLETRKARGALISVLQVLDMPDGIRYLTAALGAAVSASGEARKMPGFWLPLRRLLAPRGRQALNRKDLKK